MYPPPSAELELRRFTTASGWQRICRVSPTARSLSISQTGQRASWCVRDHGLPETEGAGEFYVTELAPRAEPRPVTEGAGRCGAVSMAPDGSGVVYLANYSSDVAPPADDVDDDMALWWAPFESGVSPLQLSTPRARILAFWWAPPVEEEFEAPEEGEEG